MCDGCRHQSEPFLCICVIECACANWVYVQLEMKIFSWVLHVSTDIFSFFFFFFWLCYFVLGGKEF